MKSTKLRDGERLFIANHNMILNRGRLMVKPGDEVILGPDDEADGIHIGNLIKNNTISPVKEAKDAKRRSSTK